MFTKFFSRLLPMLDMDFGGVAPAEPVASDPVEAIDMGAGEGANDPGIADLDDGDLDGVIEQPAQTIEERAAYAAMRRELEQRERELQERDELIHSLFEEAEDPLLAAKSYTTGKTPEQIMADAQMQAQNEQIYRELEELRQFKSESTFRSDLDAIKQVHPEIKAKQIDDLGEEFLRIMATGGIDPVTAYEIAQWKQQREAKIPPPVIGKVNQSSAVDKEFYTMEEVRAMSQEEVSKNWEKVQKSRERWK